MARPWRISLANSWHHVVSRGNGGEVLFLGGIRLELVEDVRRARARSVVALPGSVAGRMRWSESEGTTPFPEE